MKTILFSCFLLCIVSVSAQWTNQYELYYIDFEDTTEINHRVQIDSIQDSSNVWQIGVPHKNVFTSALTPMNVIVTDTDNSYPINDTSSFIIKHVAPWTYSEEHSVLITGFYQVNSDTLTDYGLIEFSVDQGITWIDLLNDTVYAPYVHWHQPNPIVLSGNSNGWQPMVIDMAPLGYHLNVHENDTLLYRFTFISDSIQTDKDGLMFDSFLFEDWLVGLDEQQNNELIILAPNPVADELHIYRENIKQTQRVQISNMMGQVLFEDNDFTEETIDLSQFPNGIYLLKFSDSRQFAVKRVEVKH